MKKFEIEFITFETETIEAVDLNQACIAAEKMAQAKTKRSKGKLIKVQAVIPDNG